MTAREICRSYHSARHKAQQIQILAELNAVDSLEIIKALVRGGERLPDSTVNKLFKRLDKLEMEIREREREYKAADAAGIEVVNADKLRHKLEYDRRAWLEEYAKLHACEFCRGSRLHTCTSYRCQQPYREAYKYAEKHFTSG